MRGTDERSGSLFSFVDLETRVPKDHPLRAIREIANGAVTDLSGEVAACIAAAGVLHDPLGTPADGTAGVRPAFPLVCRSGHRRCGVGSLGILKEPGQAARRR